MSTSDELPTRFVKVLYGASRNRKFRAMARALGISRWEAFGMSVALWEWVDTNRPFGDLPPEFSSQDLADTLGIDHIDPDDLLKAWVGTGLIDETDNGYAIHNWMRPGRTGADAERRVKRGRWAAHERHHKYNRSDSCEFCIESSDAAGAVPRHAPALPENAPTSTSTSTSTNSALGQGTDFRGSSAAGDTVYEDDDPERPFS